jgi:hypothetical protein
MNIGCPSMMMTNMLKMTLQQVTDIRKFLDEMPTEYSEGVPM